MKKFLTFDLEDWFHLIDVDEVNSIHKWYNMETRIEYVLKPILELLDQKNIKATFFILGWVAEVHPKLVKMIQQKGHLIGCHSYSHAPVWSLTPDLFKQDTMTAINHIYRASGIYPTCYRAPGFSVIKRDLSWFLETLSECRIEVDSSIFPIMSSHGGLPENSPNSPFIFSGNFGEIVELPMSHTTVFQKKLVLSGGGYFRLVPKMFIKRYFKKSDYLMTYFHMRDFDKEQPILKGLPIKRLFKSYVGISSAWKKFEEVLDCCEWNSIDNLKHMDLDKVHV